jgi:hypothetical protein
MANKKITELALLQQTAFAPTDAIPIVDDSATETKRTTVAELDLRWAAKVHSHIITDVTGLVSALNAKENFITSGTTFQYYRGDKTWQTLDKNAVGLNNVDNTSDINKPVSTATQTALNSKEDTITSGTIFQYYRGDKTWQTLNKSAVGLNNVDNTSDINKPVSTAQATAIGLKADQSSLNTHISDGSNPHSVTKTQVGLSNVDNTSDINKPVSTATQTALDLKQDILQNNIKNTLTVTANHTAIFGRIEIATGNIITIAATGRIVLI